MPTDTWHPKLDNPTFLGWTVVAFYLLAALSCACAALKTAKSPSGASTSPLGDSKIWGILGFVMFSLGINKQLNLQTLLLVTGRNAAVAAGWYGRRRFIQAVFCAAFVLLAMVLMGSFTIAAKRFFRKNPLAFPGAIVILSFVVLRALTINHANELFGIKLKDADWAWVLELSGSILIALPAAVAATSPSFPGKGGA